MKIKFPILIQYKKQYDLFMKYLDEKTTVSWRSSSSPTSFEPPDFPTRPVYILYWEKGNHISYLYKDEASWLDNNYTECEVNFED